jgi:hypothetical protein
MADKQKKRYDRAAFDRLVLQRQLEDELRRRHRAEADGQTSDGENSETAE